LKIQNNILKKQENFKINPPNKLIITIASGNLKKLTNNSNIQNTNQTSKTLLQKKNSQSSVGNENKLFQAEPSNSREINTQQIKNNKICNTVLNSTVKDYKSKQSKQKSTKPNPKKSNISQTSKLTKLLEISEENKKKNNQSAEIADQLSNLNVSVQQNNSESKTIMDQIQTVDVNQNQPWVFTLLKSPPKLSLELEHFLSEDLIKKSLAVCIIKYVNFSITFYLSQSIIIKLSYFVFRF
jgi:hypothetical protein